jgi:hypothetical protein
MMRACFAVVLLVSSRAAANVPIAYVDDVVVAGGPSVEVGRQFAASVIVRAGLRPVFAAEETDPCGDDPACLTTRLRDHGASLAVRFVITEVAGQVHVALTAFRSAPVRELVADVDLARADDRLAAVLQGLAPPRPRRGRIAAWSLLAVSVSAATAGGLATWYAYDQRARFFRDHVDEDGHVFGISPEGARQSESRARRWSLLGGVGLGLAVISGVSASVLFLRDDGGEHRPRGLLVSMEIP